MMITVAPATALPSTRLHDPADRDSALHLDRMAAGNRGPSRLEQGPISAIGVTGLASGDVDLLGQDSRELDPAPSVSVGCRRVITSGSPPRPGRAPGVDLDCHLGPFDRRPWNCDRQPGGPASGSWGLSPAGPRTWAHWLVVGPWGGSVVPPAMRERDDEDGEARPSGAPER